ncbi:hypothetical protein CMI47_04735 [Candidatus Pacearchaeota archaeon]|jgi:hypothetical protein|nr:hypothetical protein [Candidatus Pacearchaeota archaeon]|tara:strand:+ start:7651 stop:8100 length:450 start_codon:yes stop_codon:yes gene_type:complete
MNLPVWVKEFLKDKRCPYCDEKMTVGVVECLGIKILEDGVAGLFFESRCQFCDKVNQTILQTEQGFKPVELAAEIYNGLDDLSELGSYEYEIEDPSIDMGVSRLNEDEVDLLKDFLDKGHSYIDLLYFLGCSDEEIEKYAKIDLWEKDE